jgi:hypothetical protein
MGITPNASDTMYCLSMQQRIAGAHMYRVRQASARHSLALSEPLKKSAPLMKAMASGSHQDSSAQKI